MKSRKSRQEERRAGRARRSLTARFAWFLVKTSVTVLTLLVLAAGALFMAVESGALDKTLSARAEGALNGAIGPRYLAKVGKTAIRFAHNRQLAIEARDVAMVDQASGRTVSETGAIRLAMDPFRLLSGEITVTRIEAEDVRFDTALFSTGKSLDLTRVRVDSLPVLVEQGFAQLDLFGGFVDRAQTDVLDVTGMQLLALQPDGKTAPIGNARFTATRTEGGSLTLEGQLSVEQDTVPFNIAVERKLGKATALKADVSDIPLQRLGPAPGADGRIKETLQAAALLELAATRQTATAQPAIDLAVKASPGTFRMQYIDQPFDGAEIRAAYDFSKNSLEVLPSSMRFGATVLPFTGGIIDLDRLRPGSEPGYGLDLLVKHGTVAADAGGAPPIAMDAKASGDFLAASRELVLNNLAASTASGSLIGSLRMKFGGPNAEVSFFAQTDTAQTQTVKQLWPFWIAPKARQWVTANIFGGTVSNGSIAVFLPAVRTRSPEGQLLLNEDQLKISFDVANARLNVAGDIPPLRGTTGHFELRGPTVTINIKSGTSYFPTDRSVSIDGGTFTIPNFDQKPLVADMAIGVSGAADAVAELLTYRPISFLSRTGLTPEDVAGNVRAQVQARFGLNPADTVKPTWKASMALNDVDLMKPYQGRRITNLTGTLDIDPEQAVLAAKGKLDGAAMELSATEPVAQGSTLERKRELTVDLVDKDLNRLFPTLEEVLGGSVKARVELLAEDRQKVEADLSKAVLKVPGTGWTKGAGIPAKASMEIVRKDDVVTVDNLAISGEGFGVTGDVQTKDGKLVVASFDKVKLSGNDNFGLKVKPIKAGYDIAISGASADARAAISRLREAGTESEQQGKTTLVLRAKLDTVYGFGDETLRNVELAYAPFSAAAGKLQLSGVSKSGQALVAQVVDDAKGQFIQITSSDAGSTFRFFGLYSRLQKGLLNTRIRPGANGSWSGNIDLRDFQLANEERLQSMVSTPASRDGRSLNKAVKRDIDVRSERFQRGFAYFSYVDGALRIENGILRGTQVGATFQGMVRDRAGNMDVTGTFMPAYGLNRLFAELPVIGVLLGNGRDRGLLGITFKLTGPFDKPSLTINPLSIIAPGIFRQIFEFQ
jgi:hypothetical protein